MLDDQLPCYGFVLAGKAYDAAWIREMIEAQDAVPAIPDRSGASTRDRRSGAESLLYSNCDADTALAFNAGITWESTTIYSRGAEDRS